ncbi:hypothetical protein SacsacDRAFT_0145 [Saccharibacillus sacchari DSM 19268]|uniref:Uncharacterized protein n=1 Tax=Saccharibacillus sacchari DSM 19268 TaxID=915437 RepID=A0A010YSM3_9BACL|nr:hypothetical protein SacsacDRAFT_0145 [Saccharibacillus sacchari DSM 19268]
MLIAAFHLARINGQTVSPETTMFSTFVRSVKKYSGKSRTKVYSTT